MTTWEFPPAVRPTPEWLAGRRAHLVAELDGAKRARPVRRLRWRLVLVALVAVILFAGAALAVNSAGLLDWMRSSAPGQARFSVDPTRTVNDPIDSSLVCAEPGDGRFECVPGARGEWVYEYYQRVDFAPPITRASILEGLDQAAADGADPALLAEFRHLLDELGDDFFVRLDVARVMSIGSAEMVRPGVLLLPPEGIPQFVTCEPDGIDRVECRDLAAAVDVPVGAPIYGLAQNTRWVERPAPSEHPDPLRVEDFFGRELTAAEKRFLLLMGVPADQGTGAAETDSETVTIEDDR